jgi:hypothetical protein
MRSENKGRSLWSLVLRRTLRCEFDNGLASADSPGPSAEDVLGALICTGK